MSAAHARIACLLADALARRCGGLAVNEFEILLRLDRANEDRQPNALRLGELLSAVPLTQPALSRAVARMADRGWLARSAAPGDGRGVLIAITAAGRDVLGQAIPVHADTIRSALLDRLSEAEEVQVADVLRRVAEG